jgi:hypothetical protein
MAEKMDLKYVLDYMQNIWLIVTMVIVGIIIGMAFLPETRETGFLFLLFSFMQCYFWMSYILWSYDQVKVRYLEGIP